MVVGRPLFLTTVGLSALVTWPLASHRASDLRQRDRAAVSEGTCHRFYSLLVITQTTPGTMGGPRPGPANQGQAPAAETGCRRTERVQGVSVDRQKLKCPSCDFLVVISQSHL